MQTVSDLVTATLPTWKVCLGMARTQARRRPAIAELATLASWSAEIPAHGDPLTYTPVCERQLAVKPAKLAAGICAICGAERAPQPSLLSEPSWEEDTCGTGGRADIVGVLSGVIGIFEFEF
jgi:hypothetical protein